MARAIPGKERKGGAAPEVGPPARGGLAFLRRLRDEIDRLFDRFFTCWPIPWEQQQREGRIRGVDVEGGNGAVNARAVSPGSESGDFELQARDGKPPPRGSRP